MPARRRSITTIDLFCGAGLLSAGFQRRGFTPILALDLDPQAIRSYNANVAPVARVGSASDVRDDISCKVLLSGPPCQGFSTLGRRDPKDARNALCLHVPKWARATGAEVVVVENVPPFLESSQFKKMRRQLVALDYEIITWVLDAADYGTPQHRVRAFTIASRIGLPRPPRKKMQVPIDDVFMKIRRDDPMHLWPTPSDLAVERFRKIPAGGDWRDVYRTMPRQCPPSWRSLGANATDIWGRVKLGVPSNTLKSRFQNPSLGRYIHPRLHRVISLREGARIQGIPDDWILFGRREAIVRQIGNGVPIPLGTAVASAIHELLL